jgi:predicted enzyme related to lactoylglutathione lyase
MSTTKPRIHGIGGLFFKARDPKALAAWYAEHLGMPVQDWGGAVLPWRRAEDSAPACTVWGPFQEDTRYFEPSGKAFMINLRVDDLDAMLEALRDAGCRVLDRREDSEQGRFGYVLDPEDTLIELWQPAPDCDAAACAAPAA